MVDKWLFDSSSVVYQTGYVGLSQPWAYIVVAVPELSRQ